MNRNEITEQQITELMQAIPRAEEVDALRAEVARLRADNDHLRQARNDALDGGDVLKAEVERLRALYEKGVVTLVMIERMAAGGIYSRESIHATAVAAIKDLWGEGDGR